MKPLLFSGNRGSGIRFRVCEDERTGDRMMIRKKRRLPFPFFPMSIFL